MNMLHPLFHRKATLHAITVDQNTSLFQINIFDFFFYFKDFFVLPLHRDITLQSESITGA